MKKFLLLVLSTCFWGVCIGEDYAPIVAGNGELNAVSGHIQGICASDDALYIAHQKGIFKANWEGKVIKHVEAENHTGDICFYKGKIYSAIACYDRERRGKGAIQEYSSDLEVLRRYELPFPIDGISVLNDHFYFGVGPNPPKSHRGNRLGKLAADFSGKIEFLKIDHGYPTRFGTQAITTCRNLLFVSFYGAKTPMETAVFDGDGKLVDVLNFNANFGFEALPERFKSDRFRFLKLINLYSRRKKETPKIRLDFFEYHPGKMINLSGNAD